MKVAFGMIVFNGNYVLEEVLATVYPYAEQILIAEGPVKFWQEQGYTTSTDGTNEVIDSFPDPEHKIQIVHSQYSEKDEQCQAYMKFLRDDIDYLWNLDSDEVFKPEDIEKLLGILEAHTYTSVGFKSYSFYGGFDYYLTGFEEKAEFKRVFRVFPGSYWATHRPPTMYYNRDITPNHLSYETLAKVYGIRMYHYSYVFPDQVSQKVKYYKMAVSKSMCIDDYFNRIWLPWVRGDSMQRVAIEKEFKGVHEFVPSYRGDCYTAEFHGEHPQVILDNGQKLFRKFMEQLRKY